MAHLAGDPVEMNGLSGKKKDDLESKENLWLVDILNCAILSYAWR